MEFDSSANQNRTALAAIAERERRLAAREKELRESLSELEEERRSLKNDREVIGKIESITQNLGLQIPFANIEEWASRYRRGPHKN